MLFIQLKKQILLLLVLLYSSILSFGQTGSNLNFDGVNDHVSLPANIGNALSGGTEMTIEYWFKGTNLQSGVRIQNGADYIVAGWGITNPLTFIISTDGATTGVNCAPTSGAINDDTWHHLAFVWKKNTTFAVYLDGVIQGNRVAGNVNLPVFSGILGSIGSFSGNSEFLNGNIDDVRIWTVALSADDIASRRNCELVGNETGLLAYYKFNQGVASSPNPTISTLTDVTTNNFTGTLSGFALTGSTSNWLAGSPLTSGALVPTAPTAISPQIYSGAGTIANLTASGNNLKWYSAATLGSPLAGNTALVDGSTYYVSQTVGTCESTRTAVVVSSVASHLNFDGTNDHVSLPVGIANTLSNTAEITIEYWFKGSVLQSGVRIQSGGNYIVAGWGASPSFIVSTDGGTSGVSCGNPLVINDNNWHHLAFVWKKNTTFATYLDGVLQNSRIAANVNLPILTGNNTFLGSASGTSEFLNGNMDDVRIWNVALSANDIALRRNCELVGNETGLLAYYKFNQGKNATANPTVTSLTDATSNAFNGTLANFALTGSASNWLSTSAVITGSLIPTAPTANAQSFSIASTVANLVPTPSATTRWYNVATGGSPLLSTAALISDTYYVTAVNVSGCESPRTAVDVTTISPTIPSITSFTPLNAKPGDVVTLTGIGFSNTITNNVVFFGATKANITASTNTSLTVTVPLGATYAPITFLNKVSSLASYSLSNFTPTYSPAKTSITTTDFLAKQDFTTGNIPYSAAIGDLDGDGKPDLAMANATSQTVSVFRNTSNSGSIGSGSFAVRVDFATESVPISIAIGDLDGDGKPDLAVANAGSSSVSVFRNTASSGSISSGSFAAKVDFITGIEPYSVAISDLDGDGKPDLAVANASSNSVSVLRNTASSGSISSGSFAAKVDFTTGSFPQTVAISDLDGDGKSDLAVTNNSANTVSVLRNTASIGNIATGSFAAKVDFATGDRPRSIAIGDLDGDGKPDLAVTNGDSNTVSVLRNTASIGSIATGSFAAKVDFATGNRPTSVDIGDLDGDGKPDLAVANLSLNTISVLHNTATSGSIGLTSFATKVDFATGDGPNSIAIGDLDGDGKPDLVVTNSGAANVSVIRNSNNNANLSGLTISTGTLTPAFGTETLAYTTNVNFATNSISITPTAFDSNSSISINGTIVISGISSNPIALNVGSNTITILVTAQNAITKTYTINFIRGEQPPTITSFTPLNAKPGDFVTLTGTGFNTTATNNVVFFGATRANVTAATATNVMVTVPTGATFAPITLLNTGTNLACYSLSNFTPTYSPAKTSITANDFVTKVDIGAGASINYVAIGDLDGDGKPDLVVANGGTGDASVYRNTSTSGSISAGSFAAKVDFAIGVSPQSVTIGDLDGDGKLDLVIVSVFTNKISVLRNTSTIGSVSFAAKQDFTVENSSVSVAIGDLDRDGKPDLAVANLFERSVSILHNTSTSGNISFAAKVDFPIGNILQSIALGDLDGDGKLDLALSGSSNVFVLRNTSTSGTIGSGSFATKQDFTAEVNNESIAIGDLDGDGKLDLAVIDRNLNSVSVIRNTSIINSGSISFAAKQGFTIGPDPFSIVIGDLDGDGKPDLATANSDSNSVSVIRNTSTTGSISFAAKVNFTTDREPRSIAIGDLDGDGKPDLATGNRNSGNVSVIRNADLPPTITSFTPLSAKPGEAVTITGINFNTTPANNIVFFGATRATVNASTATSLTVTLPTGATYAPITLLNTGNSLAAFSRANFTPTYSPTKTSITSTDFLAKQDFATGTNPYSVAIGDLDGDGKPDLAVVNQNSNTVSVYHNTSTSGSISSSSFAAKVDFATGSNPYSVAIGDLDGDGKPDLVVVNLNSNNVSVYRNTATNGSISSSSFAAKVDFTTGIRPLSVAIGDFDGDGKPDLAVANFSSDNVSVYRNTSTSGSITTSSFATKLDFTTGSQPYSLAIGDFDGDGKPDLAVTNRGSNNVSILHNTAISGIITTSSFATKIDFTTGSAPSSVVIGDLDGDGKPDLGVTNEGSANVSVFRNSAISGSITTSSFAAKEDFTVGSQPQSVAIGDFDGDGKPDLAVANYNSNNVSVLRNTSTSGNIISSSFAAKIDFTTGTNPQSVAIGDLDGDGKPDLAVGNYGSNNVSVIRNSSNNANLSSLTLSSGFLDPAFTSATTTYSADVANATTNITVTPTMADVNATIEVRVNAGAFASVTSASPSGSLALNEGNNTINIKVTAQNAEVKTYNISIIRATPTLPVALTSFTGKLTTIGNQLNWETASEQNNSHFEIERQGVNNQFEHIATVKGNGNSNSKILYSYLDKTSTYKTSYYRLKQIDFNGKFEYSKIIAINSELATENSILIYPNPFKDQFTVKLNQVLTKDTKVELRDMFGKKVTISYSMADNVVTCVTNNLPPASYLLIVTTGKEVFVKTIVKL